MRLFVAVDLAEECRRAAAALTERLTRAIGDEVRRPPRIGWIPAERMHLTLRFIGEVGDDAAENLQRALAAPFDVGAFEVELNGIGTFPPSGPPRVIWIGITRGASTLARLHALVEQRLAPLGLEREERPFSAHLTVGRVRDRGNGALRAVLAASRFEPHVSPISHVTLYQSKLSPRGSTYVPLTVTPLWSSH